jgi:hypothetical protein
VGIREKINQNPRQTTIVTAAIVLVAILFILWQACSGGPGSSGYVSSKAFFSTDDGKTFFVDSSSNIPPFMKDGKMAVRAQVFTCDDGKTKFVGYLEMYTPQEKAMLEQMAKGGNKGGTPMYAGYGGQAMVKQPGAPPQMWIPLAPQTTVAYQTVVQPKCPGGGSQENLSRVFPD